MTNYIKPSYQSSSFHCPFCSVYSKQTWSNILDATYINKNADLSETKSAYRLIFYSSAKCIHCSEISIWYNDDMIFPYSGNIESANVDLPKDVITDYNEAKNIVNMSPRAAAALLRLGLQKLCGHIGGNGKNINDDISDLVKRGLPTQVQQALDSIRVIGNHAVHPGQIDLNDNPETAHALFKFINIICDYFITQPKLINQVYSTLPEKDLNNISKRDS